MSVVKKSVTFVTSRFHMVVYTNFWHKGNTTQITFVQKKCFMIQIANIPKSLCVSFLRVHFYSYLLTQCSRIMDFIIDSVNICFHNSNGISTEIVSHTIWPFHRLCNLSLLWSTFENLLPFYNCLLYSNIEELNIKTCQSISFCLFPSCNKTNNSILSYLNHMFDEIANVTCFKLIQEIYCSVTN